jgi:ABC-type branched-subunit amino acid transport system ATPase component
VSGTAANGDVVLAAHGLVGGYTAEVDILRGCSLEARRGEIVVVIGPNGAGKSTAFKTIVGFVHATNGRVVFDGQDITGLRPHEVLPRGLAYVPQGRIVFPQMTVLENLEMGAYIVHDRASVLASLERVYALFPILSERRGQRAGTLSGGEQQMLAMSRALSTDPKLLLLDEISMGLAPLIVAELYAVVANLAAGGLTILVVEQSARTALDVADRAAVMANGRIALAGTPDVIADSVLDIYLAGGAA